VQHRRGIHEGHAPSLGELHRYGWPLNSWRAPNPRLSVFMGPMYSGKTSAMLRELRSARQSGAFEHLLVVKSAVDTRSPANVVQSRDGLREEGGHVRALESLDDVELPRNGALVACDEAQFFADGSLLRLWERVRGGGGALLVSGLDRDFRGNAFGDVLRLASEGVSGCDESLVSVRRLVAKCTVCGGSGGLTARVSPASREWLREHGVDVSVGDWGVSGSEELSRVKVGDRESYRAVCGRHHGRGHLVEYDGSVVGSADGEWFGMREDSTRA
jgi:thymidine kinase